MALHCHRCLPDPGSSWETLRGGAPVIVTLEDVIEWLIQEEIVDETDLYVHIERRDHATTFNRRHLVPINAFPPGPCPSPARQWPGPSVPRSCPAGRAHHRHCLLPVPGLQGLHPSSHRAGGPGGVRRGETREVGVDEDPWLASVAFCFGLRNSSYFN